MKTSKEWWKLMLTDAELMLVWLEKQYHAELAAGKKIREVFSKFTMSNEDMGTLLKLAREEDRHALWLGQLLEARGVDLSTLEAHKPRYWSVIDTDNQLTLEDVAAIGHHAEVMRLERLEAIVNGDSRTPADIRRVMRRILTEELRHATIFKELSNSEAIERHLGSHIEGKALLGLEP